MICSSPGQQRPRPWNRRRASSGAALRAAKGGLFFLRQRLGQVVHVDLELLQQRPDHIAVTEREEQVFGIYLGAAQFVHLPAGAGETQGRLRAHVDVGRLGHALVQLLQDRQEGGDDHQHGHDIESSCNCYGRRHFIGE